MTCFLWDNSGKIRSCLMKYDSQLTELKNLLPNAKNILIALPVGSSIDKLAAGLALFLTLQAQGKQVSIVCEDNILVAQSHLIAVDHIVKSLPSTEGGNLTLTLEGVAASDGTVPSLEKLDWYAENGHLNLVFHVLPGQTFQPAKIIPRYQGSGFNLIVTIGAANLNALGNIYLQNQSAFSATHLVNIDNQTANSSYGQTNILDTQASSISEMMVNMIADLGYNLDADSASNLLAGIFEATNKLSDPKVSADTYLAVANCLRLGGRKPAVTQPQSTYDWNAVSAAINPQGASSQSAANLTTPQTTANAQPSPEERPAQEGVISETIEPEWLTPKIFKGTSVG